MPDWRASSYWGSPSPPAEARDLVAAPASRADPLEGLELVETILDYKFPTLSRDEIRAMLPPPEMELKKSCFYQEVFGEGHQEGVADPLLRLVTA